MSVSPWTRATVQETRKEQGIPGSILLIRGFFFIRRKEEKNMRTLRIGFAAVAVLLCMLVGVSSASDHGKDKDKKVGILLVAFGSSEKSAQISFENIDKKVKATYPDIPVRWAYTSHIIRKKLAGQGKHLDSTAVALAKMQDEGFTHVAVQSLHTIGGSEYHDLRRVVGSFQSMGSFTSIILGYPLLSTQKDMEKTVDALLSIIPKERKKDEAVVFMGHGTHHPANAFYAALMFQLQLRDQNVYIGTVEGYPELDTIEALLKKSGSKKVYLMPFMSVAGDHAKNDMASDDDDSWKSILTKSGFECIPVLKGTAEFDQFVDIWVEHLSGPLNHF
jgi:sirohydrochlorin cobaltochelatase